LQAFFFGVCFPYKGIHPKDHPHLVYANLDPLNKGTQHLALAMPFQCGQVLMHLRRKFFHMANNQLEFTLQRLGRDELVTLGFDVRNALTQSCHARLEFLLFNQALRIAIDKPS
jgi:hypothetical protein